MNDIPTDPIPIDPIPIDDGLPGGSVPSGDRRPLASRDTGWARLLARRAAAAGMTPNGISLASTGFAGLAGAALWASHGAAGPAGILWLLLAALGCQLRLVCNLIDGMVAIEGGRASPTGALWNELPDRVSDVLVLVAVGVAAEAPLLGWAAAAAAVLTAYVRELGHRLTGTADFTGVMAKPQRMAVVTLACGLAIVVRLFGTVQDGMIFRWAIIAVLIGATWVTVARTRGLLRDLRESARPSARPKPAR